ncbi:MAG: hypothetical protein A2066_18955 [Bacteroidetes bacterium GWB2_41_8]|nr:MAG: hypothetical protein A2066_18955 [Bacteroidetes bacterium GWB2_41_8]
MIQPLLALYQLLESKSSKFTDAELSPISFIDIYRSQPLEPQLYDYFPLPALFVDYSMQGKGINQPRLITMTLHVVTDELPDASNISEQKTAGLNRFLYLLFIQQILEGSKLGKTSALKFISEGVVDIPVANYHTQSYEFEAYPADMIGDITTILGEFERLNIYSSLLKNL